MTPREIIDDLGEALGICDNAKLLKYVWRAVELLSAKGLFDSQIGYMNFNVTAGNFIALPREVRAILALNINNQPSFARDKFYEFDLNGPGTVEGDSVQWEWNDRANVPIQDETKLPGLLTYKCVSSGDNGKTAEVTCRDATGREFSMTLAAHQTTPTAGGKVAHEIVRVSRQAAGGECKLYSNGELISQYYGDELEPNYRSIRLSKAVSSVRIMFRRNPLKITTLDSYIPLTSPMAVIEAAKAVRYMMAGEEEKIQPCIDRAAVFIAEDQKSREEPGQMARDRQQAGTLGTGLGHSEGITVLDIYDTACEIFGRQGRHVLFKKITQAVQTLLGKAHWDDLIGVVDICPRSNEAAINQFGGTGHGYFTLPRFCGTPLRINVCGSPMIPRNQWYDFHLNGDGELSRSAAGTWDDLGRTPIIDFLPVTPGAGVPVPTLVIALCDNGLDVNKSVRIYGLEQLADGTTVEVWRDGEQGWTCPCVTALQSVGATAPKWVKIDRIERVESRGFVRLWCMKETLIPGAAAVDVITLSRNILISKTWTGNPLSSRVYVKHIGSEGDPVEGQVVAPGNGTGTRVLTLLRNTLPVGISLERMGLYTGNTDDGIAFGVAATSDLILYPQTNTVGAPQNAYYYSSGETLLSGWRRIGTGAVSDNFVIPPGATFWLSRYASGGFTWHVPGEEIVIYGDAACTVQVGTGSLESSGSSYVWHVAFTINEETFNGLIRPTENMLALLPQNWTITRAYTPAVAPSTSRAKTRLLGLWYPDEVEPSYSLIRLPGSHPKRIRVIYRKDFKRIVSLYDHIPLRSSLAVENMLRAMKAQELGLIENAEPLEMKAVRLLAEDRIKTGQNEMPVLEFDQSTGPGGWDNVT